MTPLSPVSDSGVFCLTKTPFEAPDDPMSLHAKVTNYLLIKSKSFEIYFLSLLRVNDQIFGPYQIIPMASHFKGSS